MEFGVSRASDVFGCGEASSSPTLSFLISMCNGLLPGNVVGTVDPFPAPNDEDEDETHKLFEESLLGAAAAGWELLLVTASCLVVLDESITLSDVDDSMVDIEEVTDDVIAELGFVGGGCSLVTSETGD
jgi:hypothetical protein